MKVNEERKRCSELCILHSLSIPLSPFSYSFFPLRFCPCLLSFHFELPLSLFVYLCATKALGQHKPTCVPCIMISLPFKKQPLKGHFHHGNPGWNFQHWSLHTHTRTTPTPHHPHMCTPGLSVSSALQSSMRWICGWLPAYLPDQAC